MLDQIEHLIPSVTADVIATRLQGPSGRSYLRHALAFSILDERTAAVGDILAAEFSQLLRGTELSDGEIDSAYVAIEQAVATAARTYQEEVGEVPSDATRREQGERAGHAYLQSIHRNLEVIANATTSSVLSYEDFAGQYLTGFVAVHETITPPNFDNRRKVQLDSLFVEPNVVSDGVANEPRYWNYRELAARSGRSVLLGDPGGGKSTTAQKLALDLARKAQECERDEPKSLPLHMTLRELDTKTKGSLVSRFYEDLVERYEMQKPPTGVLEWYLSSGCCFVVFDGLDELLETVERERVVSRVEAFAAQYPDVTILCTSRAVGYSEAPLRRDMFDVFRLGPMNADQVDKYVDRWFSMDEDLKRADGKKMATSFVNESVAVSDLRVNPLMLSLMCNIYRAEGYIPANRPALYEKCALMLFEKWDKNRGIKPALPFEKHLRPAMQHLAYWIYGSSKRQAGVARSDLVTETTGYLHGRRFEEADDAREAAVDFVDYCRGRAWVFSEVGSTRTGEGIFQFTHRTFLEFFTASYLVRTRGTPAQLERSVGGRIERAEWDVVAEVAVQQCAEENEDGAAVIIERLLKRRSASENPGHRWNLAVFLAKCLSYLVPPPALVREIVGIAASSALDLGDQGAEAQLESGGASGQLPRSPRDLLTQIWDANVEQRATASEALASELRLGDLDAKYRPRAAAAALVWSEPAGSSRHAMSGWGSWLQSYREENRSELDEMLTEELWLAVAECYRGHVGPDELVRLHGPEALLASPEVPPGHGMRYVSLQDHVVSLALSGNLSAAIEGKSGSSLAVDVEGVVFHLARLPDSSAVEVDEWSLNSLMDFPARERAAVSSERGEARPKGLSRVALANLATVATRSIRTAAIHRAWNTSVGLDDMDLGELEYSRTEIVAALREVQRALVGDDR